MASLSEHNPEPGHEHGFRRGYTHGAQAVITAIGEQLTETQRATLDRWMTRDVLTWAGEASAGLQTPPDPPAV